MKKNYFLLVLLVGIILLAFAACSNSDDENPFVGKWKLMIIEDGDSVIDRSSDNQIMIYHYNGYLEGFEQKATYNYDDQFLYYHFSSGGKSTYSYSFEDSHTLRIKLLKIDGGDNYEYYHEPLDPLTGKTQVYRIISN